MVVSRTTAERKFLIDLAVTQFNIQYGRNIDPKLCAVRSINTSYGCSKGYEITTIQQDDFLRLRIYFTLAAQDHFEPYRLEVDNTFSVDNLGDEVYVMLGTVDNFYVYADIYRFRWLDELVTDQNYALFMAGDFIEFMDGTKVSWMP